VAAKKSSGEAAETLEVVDVAQLLAKAMAPAEPGDQDATAAAEN
jgi:hypothetical protein